MNRNAKIKGTGAYVPDLVYTNQYLESIVETSDEWIHNTLGIKERRIAADNQATSDLAWRAGAASIEDARLSPEDIDLIIVATATPDRLAPSTACIVQEKLRAYKAAAFDVAAVCSGFLFGLSIAAQYIASGFFDNVLVIGADTFSKITDWNRRDCVFFGDGAGAAVLSPASEGEGFLSFKLYSDGRGKFNWTIPAGGSEMPASKQTVEEGLHYFRMNGKEVFRTATRVLPKAIRQVLYETKLSIENVSYLIPHQPSIGILKKTAEIIGLPFNKVLTNMEKYANTSGGTIPILLDEANKNGQLKIGDNILLAAVGAGWTWGAAILKWT